MSYIPSSSGAYTPTLTDVTNINNPVSHICQWMRLGDTVTVSGRIEFGLDATGAFEIGISLPIASDFTADEDCAGVGQGTILSDLAVYIKADTTNNRAAMIGTDSDVTSEDHYFTFTYRIK